MMHLLAVAFWFGALVPLYLRGWRPGWCVILLAGIAMAAIWLPSVAALREPYGQLLIAKMVGFALLMGLAAVNKWRLWPALAQGSADSGRRFRRAVSA